MKLYKFHERIPASIHKKLKSTAEESLVSPIKGLELSYKISDYTKLSRSLGESRTFIVEHNGKIVAEATVIRRLFKDPILYVADVWLDKDYRQSAILFRLLKAIKEFGDNHSITQYFSIVRDYTEIKPSAYSGRLGLPHLKLQGKCFEVFIPTAKTQDSFNNLKLVRSDTAIKRYQNLSKKEVFKDYPNLRSSFKPKWLSYDLKAIGQLENVRRVAKTKDLQGNEVIIGNLLYLYFEDLDAGSDFLKQILFYARVNFKMNYIHFMLEPLQYEVLESFLLESDAVITPMDIYSNMPIPPNLPLTPY